MRRRQFIIQYVHEILHYRWILSQHLVVGLFCCRGLWDAVTKVVIAAILPKKPRRVFKSIAFFLFGDAAAKNDDRCVRQSV